MDHGLDQKKPDGSVMPCEVPGVEIKHVKNPVQGSRFFVSLHLLTPQASHLSHPSEMEVTTAF